MMRSKREDVSSVGGAVEHSVLVAVMRRVNSYAKNEKRRRRTFPAPPVPPRAVFVAHPSSRSSVVAQRLPRTLEVTGTEEGRSKLRFGEADLSREREGG
jgi:hypothetical protein